MAPATAAAISAMSSRRRGDRRHGEQLAASGARRPADTAASGGAGGGGRRRELPRRRRRRSAHGKAERRHRGTQPRARGARVSDRQVSGSGRARQTGGGGELGGAAGAAGGGSTPRRGGRSPRQAPPAAGGSGSSGAQQAAPRVAASSGGAPARTVGVGRRRNRAASQPIEHGQSRAAPPTRAAPTGPTPKPSRRASAITRPDQGARQRRPTRGARRRRRSAAASTSCRSSSPSTACWTSSPRAVQQQVARLGPRRRRHVLAAHAGGQRRPRRRAPGRSGWPSCSRTAASTSACRRPRPARPQGGGRATR